MKATLLLEDGTVFEGESIGAPGTTIGEVVFATAMTGYQEMLTDPSFAGQLLTLTYPLVGNYGVNPEDVESSKIQVEGFIVRELCETPSNWRMSISLRDYLAHNGIVSMQGVDTRALTRHLRVRGVMMGAMSTELTTTELKAELDKAPNYGEINFVERVSTKVAYEWVGDECSKLPHIFSSTEGDGNGKELKRHVALVDMGIKRNIARCLAREGCRVTVLPHNVTADDVLAVKPDGVVFSPGPGDPKMLTSGVETMRNLIGRLPIMGICLGHQMLGLALGGDTFKLKFGHRGANHPVKNLLTGKVSITAQNHGYAVDPDRLSGDVEVERINLNDGTVEGLRHRFLPIFSIQYHPEASAGPLDEGYLFKEFVASLADN
ncbi:MAG: glutamine-hydrolyzing carbamoyl-phosphate synthase small subunit [Armatimonadetes bacterium]|nr:glutamine-hydrolyzing carbamoyl-phosphate synthase small subunit [Armatimonadota bacterium]